MKKLSFILFFILSTFCSLNLFSQKIKYDELVELASMINDKCPILIDKYTRFDNCGVYKDPETLQWGYTIQYNYTTIKWYKEDLDLKETEKEMKSSLINKIRIDDDLEILRNNNIVFVYKYVDKIGDFLFKITITPKDYKDNI